MPIEIIDLSDEIIDLTGSSSPSPPPISSHAPRNLNLGSGSINPFCPNNFNPNLFYTNYQQNTQLPASGYIYHPSHYVGANFHPNMHVDQVANVLNPMPLSSVFLYPNGIQLNEPWTWREHELFVMGLMKYGDGSWIEISKHLLCNKTPSQVQSYAVGFFKHLSNTFPGNTFGRRNQTFPAYYNIMTAGSNNLFGTSSASYSLPPMMIANETNVQQTLMLFPEKPRFSQSVEASNDEEATTSYGYGYGFQAWTNVASANASSSVRQRVDLELRLG